MSDQKSNKMKKTKFSGISNPKKKWIVFVLPVLVILISGGVIASWLISFPAPDPSRQTPTQQSAYIASERFARLDARSQQAYLEQVRRLNPDFRRMRGDLDEDQRRQMRDNMREIFRQEMDKRMDDFFAKSPEERTQHLDQILDQRLAGGGRGPGGFGWGPPGGRGRNRPPGGPGGGRGAPSAERIQRRIEQQDPQRHAKRMEFREALEKRAKERGIEMPQRR